MWSCLGPGKAVSITSQQWKLLKMSSWNQGSHLRDMHVIPKHSIPNPDFPGRRCGINFVNKNWDCKGSPADGPLSLGTWWVTESPILLLPKELRSAWSQCFFQPLRERWNSTYMGYYFTERLSKAIKTLAMKIHRPQSSRIYFLISSGRLTLLKAQLHC